MSAIATSEPVGIANEAPFLERARRILAGEVRAEDYLVESPRVRRIVDMTMEDFRARGNGQPLAPEVEPRQLHMELLSYHFGGRPLLYIEDERGVMVVAVEGEQIEAVIREFGETHSRQLNFDIPLNTYFL